MSIACYAAWVIFGLGLARTSYYIATGDIDYYWLSLATLPIAAAIALAALRGRAAA